MTLGELKEKLDPIKDQEGYVSFEFAGATPTEFDSYRGYYDEIALGFTGEYSLSITIEIFYNMVIDSIGREFIGWKGGEFIMTKDTPIWVACTGNTSNTILSGIEINKLEYDGSLTWVTLKTEESEG